MTFETIYKVAAGHTITVAKVNNTGHVRQVQDPTIGAVVTSSHAFGPYALSRDFIVQGDVSVVIAESDLTANIPSTAQAAILDAIPAVDQADSVSVWNDEGVLKVSTAP